MATRGRRIAPPQQGVAGQGDAGSQPADDRDGGQAEQRAGAEGRPEQAIAAWAGVEHVATVQRQGRLQRPVGQEVDQGEGQGGAAAGAGVSGRDRTSVAMARNEAASRSSTGGAPTSPTSTPATAGPTSALTWSPMLSMALAGSSSGSSTSRGSTTRTPTSVAEAAPGGQRKAVDER